MRKPNTLKDFACKGQACCGGIHVMVPRAIEAFAVFEDCVHLWCLVKKTISEPLSLIIGSAFRCHSYNGSKLVGSNRHSYHPQGMAIDVLTPQNMHLLEFLEIALRIPEYKSGGVGVYTWGLHVDVRDIGKPVRWYAVEINRR